MAHGITKNDQVVLTRERAWHGLGIVLRDAPTPREALVLADAAWHVEQHTVWVYVNGTRVMVPGRFANYRSDLDPAKDENAYLGMVSDLYNPVDNDLLAEFCYDIAKEGSDVRVESCGTVYGGKKIWFLLKAEAFDIGKSGDNVVPYLLVSNSHDGTGSLRITPTTVRVVCQNTLHMVVPAADTGALGRSALAYRHTSSIRDRVQAARLALAGWGNATKATRDVCDLLAAKPMTDDERKAYFFRRYECDFGVIDPKSEREVAKAGDAYRSFCSRWDDESPLHGGTVWGALNAYTGLVQHDQKARGRDDVARVERRVDDNLFGLRSKRTQAAFQDAIALVS